MSIDRLSTAIMIGARRHLLDTLITNLVERAYDEGLFRTCLNCQHWKHEQELCGFENCNQRPPATIIVCGCKSHSDLTPF